MEGQHVRVRPRRTLAEIKSCGPWQMAATGFPASIMSRARSTIAWRIRILSGACPPGITSASKSVIFAAPAAMSAVTVASPRLPRYCAPFSEPTIDTAAPALFSASSGPVSSRSSNSSSTSIATRRPARGPVIAGNLTSIGHLQSEIRNVIIVWMNRLRLERSPYLLQHASNPVEWFAWGDDAFEKSRAEHKPIFLSIGYSTCHWCHVMERESFENAGVAAVLNEHFVSVKVDREERPDVDRVYMTFVQRTTGSGGWPMSVWLTPELKPFYGGTYFPPASMWGKPAFVDILREIARVWTAEPESVRRSADGITAQLQAAAQAAPMSSLQ